MSNRKKILIYIIKLAVLLGLFAALSYGWIIFAIYMSGGLFNTPTDFQWRMLWTITIAAAIGYTALAVWVSRLGVEKKADRASMTFIQKLRRPLGLMIPLAIMIICYLYWFNNWI